MKDLSKMTITVDRRQEYKGSETIYSDLRVWLRMEAPEGSPGLTRISFLLLGDEGPDLFAGRAPLLADGYHLLKTCGELWMFFDDNRLYDDLANGTPAGEASVSYRRVTIPVRVRPIIQADIEDAIARYDAQGAKRKEIRLDYSDKLAEWSECYGRGKGDLAVEGPVDEIETLKGERTFDRSWETLTALALNTTYAKGDTGYICIRKESPTMFLWSAGSMHGGLCNHGSAEDPDWSVHT